LTDTTADLRRQNNARLRRERLVLHVLVTVLVIAVMFPFIWILVLSVKPAEVMFAFPPQPFFTPTIEHYVGLWDGDFPKSFMNSLITSVGSTVAAMLLGVPGAYALSRMSPATGSRMSLVILASRMAPPIAFTIPYFLAYRHLGLQDTRVGLIIIYLTFNLSLVIWLMRSFFDTIPRSLEEAAWIDGASYWQSFTRIVLPMTGPGLAATAILCFLYSWNDFFFALILTRTEATTAPVAGPGSRRYSPVYRIPS
jgi:multiple sugar transport system permease protein